jgi:UDP-glucose 4-epimerase
VGAVLVTGIAGGLARRVAERLVRQGHQVVGVDYRRVRGEVPASVEVLQAHYHKTAIEDVFRHRELDAVLHLGRVGNLSEGVRMRFDLNVLGTQKLMELCLAHQVRSLVVLSTFHIYGADPRNPTPISESEPLRAGYDFPEIADAIQLDNMASTWVYQHPQTRAVVLRPTNVVGPSVENTISKLLRLRRVPYMVGFDPMMQFIHEDDLADAIIAAFSGSQRGVFNVTGPAVLPWRGALQLARRPGLPIPSSLSKLALRAFSSLPAYLVNFLKYPCVINDAAFRSHFGWTTRRTMHDTIVTTLERAQA